MMGKVIRKKRLRMKMTQKDLAEKIGISPTSISFWESDKVIPKSKFFLSILKILNLRPEDFEKKEKKNV